MTLQGITTRPRPGAKRSRPLAVLTLVLLACGACGLGLLGPTARAGAAGVSPARVHLTPAESQAVRIASVSAVGDDSLGLLVSVQFEGNIERYLGQGDLKQGMLALVLAPSAGGQTPNGVVDVGGGFTTPGFPILTRHRKRITVKHAILDAFGSERVIRVPVAGQETVVRNGNQVIFYLPAIGLAAPTNVTVKIFARSPATLAKTGKPVSAAAWRKIVGTPPTTVGTTTVIPTQLTLGQLETVRGQLAARLDGVLQPELRREQRAHSALRADMNGYAANANRLKTSLATLSSDFGQSVAGIKHVQTKISAVNKLIGHINTLIAATASPPVSVVQTDSGFNQEMSAQAGLVNSTIAPQGVPMIDVNDAVRYQRFSGLGAALPDSSAWLIYDNLAPSTRQALMQAMFGSPGAQNGLGVPAIHLNFLRVPIAAGGAMTVGSPYSYDDNPPAGSDPNLTFFSTSHDTPYIVPTIQEALSVNPSLQILANPWSPPAWMKSNDSLDNAGGQGTLLPSDYGAMANYFVKFIQAYEADGIPIDALTPQNEPTVWTDYPGLNMTEAQEAQFIAQYLEPALRAAGLDPKLYGNDLSWDSSRYADDLAADPVAGPELAGMAWHCYYGQPGVMSQLHQTYPGLDQIVSECSPEIRSFGTPEFLISALRNWASTVSVWALALDPNGGPIQPNNNCGGCRGPVTINEQTQTVTFRTEYYQLGQVSAFVQPGATRIGSPSYVTYGVNAANIETVSAGLDDVAFENPDGTKVLIVFNTSPGRLYFGVDWHKSYFTYAIPSHAMTTFTWR